MSPSPLTPLPDGEGRRWRIWYSDGSTFSSADGTWEEAPGRDVQIILFHDPDRGWTLRHGANTRKGDFFRMDPDREANGTASTRWLWNCGRARSRLAVRERPGSDRGAVIETRDAPAGIGS